MQDGVRLAILSDVRLHLHSVSSNIQIVAVSERAYRYLATKKLSKSSLKNIRFGNHAISNLIITEVP